MPRAKAIDKDMGVADILPADTPILVVTMGRAHRVEIGPRTSEPGYPTYIYFMYWDVKRKGEGRGDDTPMCAIKLTREWYENFIRGKEIHEWLNSYDKLLARFEKEGTYSFGCPVCGDTLKRLKEYRKHLEGHRNLLKDFMK